MPTNPTTKKIPQALLERIIWCAITTGLIVIYFTVGQDHAKTAATPAPAALAFIGILPLAFSTAMRWMMLPRMTEPQKRLPLFIVGVALAESCGVLGIFLGGEHKDTLFVLSLLGLAQYFPAFLPRLGPPPASFR